MRMVGPVLLLAYVNVLTNTGEIIVLNQVLSILVSVIPNAKCFSNLNNKVSLVLVFAVYHE